MRRRDAWLTYGQALIDGLSVRKAATLSGVHRTTAFRWRHRMLQHPAEENGSELSTLVEPKNLSCPGAISLKLMQAV